MRDYQVTGVQTCALPISRRPAGILRDCRVKFTAMSDETPAPPPAPAAPLSPAEEKVNKAMDALGRALAGAGATDKKILATLKDQTEQAAKLSGPEFDKRLEFCYAIVFSPELTGSARILAAAQTYIDAVKALQES